MTNAAIRAAKARAWSKSEERIAAQILRCKIGDLAIVASAKLPQNLGQIVEVLGPQTGFPFWLTCQGHVWHVRAVSGRESLHYHFAIDGRVVRRVEGPVPDCRLRPISGLDPRTEAERVIDDLAALLAPSTIES